MEKVQRTVTMDVELPEETDDVRLCFGDRVTETVDIDTDKDGERTERVTVTKTPICWILGGDGREACELEELGGAEAVKMIATLRKSMINYVRKERMGEG